MVKQNKNRNETGSDLSLDERLTRLLKRLSRKRCCDTTPDRFQEGNRQLFLVLQKPSNPAGFCVAHLR